MTVREWLQKHEDDYRRDAGRETRLIREDPYNKYEHVESQNVLNNIAATFRLTRYSLPKVALDAEMEDNNDSA